MARRTIRRIISTDSTSGVISGTGDTIAGIAGASGESGRTDSVPDGIESGVRQDNAGNDSGFVDPTRSSRSDPDGNDPGSRTRRGRPVGSRNQNKAVQGSITSLLFSLHMMGSAILKVPELELSEVEAKKLNDAITDVMRFYTDVEISPVVQAWLNLAMVGGVVYGPRFMAYNIRNKARAKTIAGSIPLTADPSRSQPAKPFQSNVTPFRNESKPDGTKSQAPQPTAKAANQPTAPLLNLHDWSAWNAREATIGISE